MLGDEDYVLEVYGCMWLYLEVFGWSVWNGCLVFWLVLVVILNW